MPRLDTCTMMDSNVSGDDISFFDHSRFGTDHSTQQHRPSPSEQNLKVHRRDMQQQSSSWLTTLSSWRLSRSELDPNALAVFSPLENEIIPLDIVYPSPRRQSFAYPEAQANKLSPTTHNQDLETRSMCILAVFIGVCIAVASIAIGTSIIKFRKWPAPDFLVNKYINMGNSNYYFVKAPKYILHYISGHRIFSLPKLAMLLTSFLLNIGLTSVFDSMNLILSVTLRWTLFQEGHLVFNSNSRLYTSSQNFGPCHWTINILSTIALVVGYGATSILATNIYVISMIDPKTVGLSGSPITGSRYALDFNAWGMLGLGFALLLQAGLCIWALIAGRKFVRSWSSNALCNTHAYICAEQETLFTTVRDPYLPWYSRHSWVGGGAVGRTLKRSERHQHSRSTTRDTQSFKPRYWQPSASACVPLTRRLSNFVWILLVVIMIWVVVAGIAAEKSGSCSAKFVLNSAYRTDVLAYWQTYCQIMIPYINLAADPLFDRRDWLGLVIQSIGFAFISLGLHCVELLTEVIRDEHTWRKATTTGADPDAGAVVQRMWNRPCWLLFVFKCITPWIFGYAYTANLWLYMNLLPLCTLMLVFWLLAFFCEYLIRCRPEGPQPAAYGNIHKLAIFVDEWDHDRLFWGDKGEMSERVRNCGTAGQRLAEVDMRMRYSGMRA